MKKLIIFLLPIFLILNGCSIQPETEVKEKTVKESSIVQQNTYVKSIWITYYELQKLIVNNSENKFRKKIKTTFSELKNMGFNTVTVQVRPCADAFYMSKYFPSSKYCFGVQGVDMAYDPLKIMCEAADSLNLRIEAWINPYRVSQDNKINKLCDDNIAKKWYKSKKKKTNVFVTESAIYFNPASKDVINLIVKGVKEIVEQYDVDAIHFDDYFYPTTNKKIDKNEYSKYKKSGGVMSLSDWRRDNVNKMVKSVYKAVKTADKRVLFGISPASDVKNDYSKLYADVEKWSKEDGYIDYICPQIYFGFRNEKQPFMFTAKKWISFCKKDMYVGLPLYKSSKADKYASAENKDAINEFKNNNNIIARQITYISKIDDIKGFYVFSYSSLYDEKCKKEVENMLTVMQNSSQD